MEKNRLPFFSLPHFTLITLAFLLGQYSINAQNPGEIIFRDDFNGATLSSFWQKPTSWKVANQSAMIFEDGGERWLRTSNNYSNTSYIIESAAKGFTVNYKRAFRIAFGQNDATDQRMYILNYHPDNGGMLILGISTDNYYYPQVLDQGVLYPNVTPDKVYKFKIAKYESGLIQVFVDRGSGYGTVPFLEAIDNTYKHLGHVSWREDTETYAEPFYVDWISAIRPAVEKSAVREKPAEDDLVKQVSSESKRSYKVTKLAAGIKPYTDRSYTITSFPAYLNGASFVQTAMDDKKATSGTFLTSFVTRRSIVYVGYDPRASTLPDWLKSWTKTGDRIELTDPGTPYVDLYSKVVDYWQLYPRPYVLGGNLAGQASGAQMNYFFAVVEVPGTKVLEAEEAVFAGAKKATNHVGYSGSGFVDYINARNDYIEWDLKIDVPGSYYIGFTYSNGSSANRPLRIEHNGNLVTTLPFQPSFSWNSWAYTVMGAGIYFSEGNHKIRATATGSSGPNMDFLSLSYKSTAQDIQTRTAQVVLKGDGLQSDNPEKIYTPSASTYPNPFTTNTTLSYEVTEKARVTISLLSIHGSRMNVLVNEVKTPGKYTVIVDGSKLAAGTYLYRIQTGSRVSVGKLIRM